ncbi:MAG: hypothetical protein ABIN58_03355 [candidate division WOR-3 bacterium]
MRAGRLFRIVLIVLIGGLVFVGFLYLSLSPRPMMGKEFAMLYPHYYAHYSEYRAIHPVWKRYGGEKFLLSCYQRLSYSEKLILDRREIKIEATLDKGKGFQFESKVRSQLREAGLPEAVLVNFYHIPFILYQSSLTALGSSTLITKQKGQGSKKETKKKFYRYEYVPKGGYLDRLGIRRIVLMIDKEKQTVASLEILLSSGEMVHSLFEDSESAQPRRRSIAIGRVIYERSGTEEVRFTRWLRADLLDRRVHNR